MYISLILRLSETSPKVVGRTRNDAATECYLEEENIVEREDFKMDSMDCKHLTAESVKDDVSRCALCGKYGGISFKEQTVCEECVEYVKAEQD